MSRLTSDYHALMSRAQGELGRLRSPIAPRHESSRGSLIAGLVVLGVGAVVLYALAPDIRRYYKIRNM